MGEGGVDGDDLDFLQVEAELEQAAPSMRLKRCMAVAGKDRVKRAVRRVLNSAWRVVPARFFAKADRSKRDTPHQHPTA